MICAVCAGAAGDFAQHYNRDRGYGLCVGCARRFRDVDHLAADEMARLYGLPGVNYADPGPPGPDAFPVSTAIVNLGDASPWPMLHEAESSNDPTWFEVSERAYFDALGAVPPMWFKGGFFMGEASRHDHRGVSVYAAFAMIGDRHFAREVPRDRIGAAMRDLHALLAREASS